MNGTKKGKQRKQQSRRWRPPRWLLDNSLVLNPEPAWFKSRKAETKTIEPSIAQLPGFAELRKKIEERAYALMKSPELISEFDKVTDRWLVGDRPTRHTMLWAYASACSDDPMNVLVGGKFGIGKSTIAVRTSALLPEENVWSLGGLTPTALVHERGEFDEAKALHVIDLHGKIILMLDTPDPETLSRLKPIMSHDKETIDFKFTDRDKEGKFRTTTAKLSGQPVFIFATAKTEFAGEYSSRWLTVTPEVSETKVSDVIMKQSLRASKPRDALVDEDVEVWRLFFTQLSEHRYHVLIPYAPLMGRRFVRRGTESMRLYEHFLRLIKANAILHYAQREREGTDIVATIDDLKAMLPDFKLVLRSSLYGVSGDALQLLDAIAEQKKTMGLGEIGNVANRTFGAPLPEPTLRIVYVKPLVAAGLLEEEVDERDRRRRMYTARTAEKVDVFDDEIALMAEIEGKPLPEKPKPVEGTIYRTGTGTGISKEVEDKDWIGKQRHNQS